MTATREHPLVLVVEDDPDLADHLQAVLGPTCRVECAHDVALAFSHFTQRKPDVIILDCHVAGDRVESILTKAHSENCGCVLLCRDPELLPDLLAFFDCTCVCTPFATAAIRAAVDGALQRRGSGRKPPA